MLMRVCITQEEEKNFNLLLPTGGFMMQSLSLLSSNDDDRLIKRRDNLTPRHLHV
jgi:hypothetical protein